VFILCLASYCAAHRGDLDFRRLVTVLAVASVPVALIYRQPDLGTDLVFIAILMAMLLVAGARPRHIAVLTLLGVIGVVAVFQLFENVGMTMGIMPIIGIPLPFLSYGGSSTTASFAGVGLVLNVHMRRFA